MAVAVFALLSLTIAIYYIVSQGESKITTQSKSDIDEAFDPKQETDAIRFYQSRVRISSHFFCFLLINYKFLVEMLR